MALTGTDRGAGTHNTAALTFTLSPASNFGAGSMAVLCLSVDNADSGGAAHSTFTVTDTLGNTWTRRSSPLYDPGSAAAGVVGAIFTTAQNGGTLQTGTTITVTFDANTTAKVWTLMEVAAAAGFNPVYQAQGVGTGSSTASPTVTSSSLTSGDMIVGMVCNEHGTAQTPTGDSDTSNGSWSTMQTNEIGTTAAGQTIITQRKVTTATATQTYNPTLGVASDVIAAWISIREVVIESIGTLTSTLGAMTAAATGLVGIVATLAITLGALTLSGAAVLGPPVATLNATLGAATLSATGTVAGAGANGDLNVTLGALTLSSAITEVSSPGVLASGTGTAISITHGLTIQSGDVVLAFIASNTTEAGSRYTDNNGAGDAFEEDWDAVNGAETSGFAIYHRVSDGSEPASYAFTQTQSVDWTIAIRVFRGVNQANVFDVAPTTDTDNYATSGTTGTAISITTATNGALAIVFAVTDSTAGATHSAPTNGYGNLLATSGSFTQSSFSKTIPTAGATGATDFTLSVSNDWGAQHFALKPTPLGVVSVQGTATPTLGVATLSGAAVLGPPVADASITFGAATLSGAAQVAVQGSLSATLGTIALSADGTVGSTPSIGTLSVTLDAMTLAGAGVAESKGNLSATLGALTASGGAAVSVQGSASNTLGALAVSSGATLGPPVGDASITLGTLTLTGDAQVPSQGALSSTLGTIGISAAGTAGSTESIGTLNATLGTLTLSGMGAVDVQGSATLTLGTATLSGAGVVDVQGSAGSTLGALSSSATGAVSVQGAATPTLGTLALSGSATLSGPIGTLSTTLGVLNVSADGSVGSAPSIGDLTATLGTATLSGSSAVSVIGISAPTLGAITASASGAVDVQGAATPTLGSLTLSGTAQLSGPVGTATPTLDPLTIAASGGVAVGPGVVVVSNLLSPSVVLSLRSPSPPVLSLRSPAAALEIEVD